MMADGNLGQIRHPFHQQGQVQVGQVVAGIDLEPMTLGRFGAAQHLAQLRFRIAPEEGAGIGFGVDLDPVRPDGRGRPHALGVPCRHEQAGPDSLRLEPGHHRSQQEGPRPHIPAAVAGHLPGVDRDQGALGRFAFQDQVQEFLPDVTLEIGFHGTNRRRHRPGVLRGDVAPVGAGMDSDALGPESEDVAHEPHEVRFPAAPGVAQGRDLVDIHTEFGHACPSVAYLLNSFHLALLRGFCVRPDPGRNRR